MHKNGKILLISSNLWILAEGMLGPLFAVFTERIGGNILDIAWAWAIYSIVTGVCIIFVGKISDYVSKEKLMVAGYFLNALLTFGYLLISSPLQLFILQAGLGIALALADPTWYSLYDKYAPAKSNGYVWGLADGQSRIIGGIAIFIGGFIITYASFAVLFMIMGTIQTIAALYQAQILIDKKVLEKTLPVH